MQLNLLTAKRPKVDALVPQLIAVLSGRGWLTARRLKGLLQVDDRAIREAAHLSKGLVISGQRGYALTREASLEDVQHATAWMLSQASEMRRRVAEIEKVRHG